jgi:hypothetical protein
MKKKISILIFAFMLFIFNDIKAQLVYQKKFYELPAPRFSLLFNAEKSVDSGYVISGASSTTSNLAGYIFISKLNETGDTVWARTYDGPEYEDGYIKHLYDSSYVLYGELYSFNPCPGDQNDMFLMKLKANGDTVWTKHYGTCNIDAIQDLVIAPNNGYYLCGTINNSNPFYGTLLLRLNSLGDTIWTRSIDVTGVGKQQNHSCATTSDGGVIIGGSIYDSLTGPYSSYLIKIDSSGNVQWCKYIDNPWYNDTYQIIPTSTGYILNGRCNLGGTLGYGTMVLKTDFWGMPLLGKMYENINIGLKAATLQNDSTVIFTGIKFRDSTPGHYENDLISFKTNTTGNFIWAKKYVTNQLSFGAYSSISSLETNDKGFLITTTSTTDPTYNTYNGFLAKIDSLGNGCSDSTLAINIVDITSMIVTSDTINPVVGYYPVVVGHSPFNYGRGTTYMDLCVGNVGIEEKKINEDELIIYPNPNNGLFSINSSAKISQIDVLNILGEKIYSKKVSTDKTEIDLSDKSNGIYFVQVYSDKGALTKKVSIAK